MLAAIQDARSKNELYLPQPYLPTLLAALDGWYVPDFILPVQEQLNPFDQI